MRPHQCIFFIAILATAGCSSHSARPQALTLEHRAVTEADVRGFMQSVAHEVTEHGPTIWEKLLAEDPAFFMANDGRLVFPNRQAAREGIAAFARTIKHIDLRWGDDLRVDALTPSLAVVGTSWSEIQVDNTGRQVNEAGFFTAIVEEREGRWQFRDAHWSSIPPAKSL